MKKIRLIIVMMLFSTMVSACWDDEPIEEIHLAGTKWKLVGFFDIDKNELTEVEPKDCEQCYTLYFCTNADADTFSIPIPIDTNTAIGRSVSNTICFSVNKSVIKFIMKTEVYDNDAGNVVLFYDALKTLSLTPFDVKDDELRIFYNSNKNYLLYKRIE